MGAILASLIGRRVAVFSLGSQSYKDEGIVRAVDAQALQLEVGLDANRPDKAPSVLIFPLTAIRLIRRLD